MPNPYRRPQNSTVSAELDKAIAQLEERKRPFLEVIISLVPSVIEYWDATVFTPHRVGTGELEIHKDGQQTAVCLYGIGGWYRIRRVLVKPSEIEADRVDASTA